MQSSIINTTLKDLDFVYWLFDEAIIYHQRHKYNTWVGYDKERLQKDINNNLQFKILIANELAAVFSICYADPLIWREWEKADAIYLHRIVTNPKYKGQKLFGQILNWAIDQARGKNLPFVRMDTWADNPNIIDYYLSFGFKFLEKYTTPDSPELPVTHRKLNLALLQYDID